MYNESTEDILWIPSVKEVFGKVSRSVQDAEKAAVFYKALFDESNSRARGDYWWWLRSANSGFTFSRLDKDGSDSVTSAEFGGEIMLCFCT